MAEVVTYTSLVADIKRYLERGAPEDTVVFEQIPRIISLAQRSIATKFKIQGMIEVVTTAFVVGQFAYVKPDRWRQTVSMFYGSGAGSVIANPIYPRSYEYCRMYAPDTSVQGAPLFYADYNYENWLIVPTPVAAVPWEISYYQLPPLIDEVNQTNWITDYAPNALLYRCLMETATFLKQSQAGEYQALYEEEVSNLDVQDIKKIVDRSTTRDEA